MLAPSTDAIAAAQLFLEQFHVSAYERAQTLQLATLILAESLRITTDIDEDISAMAWSVALATATRMSDVIVQTMIDERKQAGS